MHRPAKNEWHDGLLKLFGYMDSHLWKMLWVIADKADENGFSEISNDEIGNALIIYAEALAKKMKWLKQVGLIRVAKRQRVNYQPVWEITQRRVLQLYGGIKRGMLPNKEAAHVFGKTPADYYSGKLIKWTFFRLLRKKHRPPVPKPKFGDYSKLTLMEKRNLSPSIMKRREYEIERIKVHVDRWHNVYCGYARNFKFMHPKEFSEDYLKNKWKYRNRK